VQREAALLADLVSEPIEDILRHAAGTTEREWLADFARRYQGKAVLFDTLLQRQVGGGLHVGYFFPGPDPVRLEVADVDLLRRLVLNQPRRVLFGVRLASVRLEPPGPTWVVRFLPDSGVLLTDPKAAGLCCPAWAEADAVRIVEEQARLVYGGE
jgi:hypothetical protein